MNYNKGADMVRYKKQIGNAWEEYEAESVEQLVELIVAVDKHWEGQPDISPQLEQEIENYAQHNSDKDETKTQENEAQVGSSLG